MEPYDAYLNEAGDALQALADGPGRAAAETLEQAFGRAGGEIEAALSKAARSGELDFASMTRSILTDLARIAAEAALSQAGLSAASRNMTVNLSVQGENAGRAGVGAGAEISKAVAQAVARGGRFL